MPNIPSQIVSGLSQGIFLREQKADSLIQFSVSVTDTWEKRLSSGGGLIVYGFSLWRAG